MQSIKNKIINHILDQNDWANTKLKRFKGKSIQIQISDIEINFLVKNDGKIVSIEKCDKPETVIKMTIKTLIDLMINKKMEDISITGDIEFAKNITDTIKKMQWDIEEDLSKLIGDLPAVGLIRIGKSIMNNTRNNVISFGETLKEYWQEENQILAKKRHIDKFINQVDIIAEDTDRLEAKINIIQSEQKE
jgi:ubiquinone biosynthesis protein UbiJ